MQIQSTRFGTVEIRDDAVITFPEGLPGLPGQKWAFVAKSDDSPFYWLHSVEYADVAIPVTSPWLFFSNYEVRVDEDNAPASGSTTRATPGSSASSARRRTSRSSRSTSPARSSSTRCPDRPPDAERRRRLQCPASPVFRGGAGRGAAGPHQCAGDGGCRIGGTWMLVISRKRGERICLGDDVASRCSRSSVRQSGSASRRPTRSASSATRSGKR